MKSQVQNCDQEKVWMKSEIKMGGQGNCSVTADGNEISIITFRAVKH